MKTAIVLLTTLLHPLVAFSEVPDLCVDVILKSTGEPVTDLDGTTLSRHCAWTGTSAPVWNADVCCDIDAYGASCSTPDEGDRCATGTRTYCKYGEQLADGAVICYQPFPSTCEFVSCESDGTVLAGDPTQADLLCCENGDCWEFDWNSHYPEDCLGTFSWCSSGYLKEDGTVDCYD